MIIPFFILIVAGLFAQDPDHWHSQIMLGECGICVWLSWQTLKRVHWAPALAFLYFSIYAVYSQYATTTFQTNLTSMQDRFDSATGRAVGFFLMCSIPFIFSECKKKSNDLESWLVGFQIFAVIDALKMILFVLMKRPATGFLGMDSIDGTFLTLIIPSFLFPSMSLVEKKNERLFLAAPIIAAMILSKSSTVYGTAVLELLLFLILNIEKTWKNLVAFLAGAIAALPLGYLYLGKELFNTNGRNYVLIKSIEFFKNYGNWFFGIGTSSFIVVMPIVQGADKPFFPWLHNEPFQVFFEQGVLGFALLLMVFGFMLFKTRKNTPLFIMVGGCGFQSFFQPSFRYFIFALFLTFVLRLSFEKDFSVNENSDSEINLTFKKGETLCPQNG